MEETKIEALACSFVNFSGHYQFIKENNSETARSRRVAHDLDLSCAVTDHSLKIHSAVKIPLPDKIDISEEVGHL